MIDFQLIKKESSKARFPNSNSQGYFLKNKKRRYSYMYSSIVHGFAGIGIEVFVGQHEVLHAIGLDVLASTTLSVWVEL